MISINALNIKGSILQKSHRWLPITSLIFARPRQHHSSAIVWTTKSKLNPIVKQMSFTNKTRCVEDTPLHQKEEILITFLHFYFKYFLPNFISSISTWSRRCRSLYLLNTKQNCITLCIWKTPLCNKAPTGKRLEAFCLLRLTLKLMLLQEANVGALY